MGLEDGAAALFFQKTHYSNIRFKLINLSYFSHATKGNNGKVSYIFCFVLSI